MSGWHWNGAEIEGSLELVVEEKTLHKRSFSYTESPQSIIFRPYSTPESAPFRVAFNKSFPDGLLGPLYDLKGLEPLISALKDYDSDVREAAAKVLVELKDPRAVELLISALKDENPSVRRAAARALKSITGKDFGTDYKEWSKWWKKNKGRFRK